MQDLKLDLQRPGSFKAFASCSDEIPTEMVSREKQNCDL